MILGDEFRPLATSTYPPFKKGRYLEEAFYDLYKYEETHTRLYIPVFWTTLQLEADFEAKKSTLQDTLDVWVSQYPPSQAFFTVVQHDDGVLLRLPTKTLIFAAGGTGHIPLPLIYEDTALTLETTPQVPFAEKGYLASFMGSLTHKVRETLLEFGRTHSKPWLFSANKNWTPEVPATKAEHYVSIVKESRFTFAPRGYGRTSFRFFEAFKLGSVPVYIWDDLEWLPYKDRIDYSKLCISIPVSELETLDQRLNISEEQYDRYMAYYQEIKHLFTMEAMTAYIISEILRK